MRPAFGKHRRCLVLYKVSDAPRAPRHAATFRAASFQFAYPDPHIAALSQCPPSGVPETTHQPYNDSNTLYQVGLLAFGINITFLHSFDACAPESSFNVLLVLRTACRRFAASGKREADGVAIRVVPCCRYAPKGSDAPRAPLPAATYRAALTQKAKREPQ